MRGARLAVLLVALAVPAGARADVIAPEEEACGGKAKGEACKAADGSGGSCQESSCWTKVWVDGRAEASSRACLTCQPGGAPARSKGLSCAASGPGVRGARWEALALAAAAAALLRRRADGRGR